jgi:hypothetical protein
MKRILELLKNEELSEADKEWRYIVHVVEARDRQKKFLERRKEEGLNRRYCFCKADERPSPVPIAVAKAVSLNQRGIVDVPKPVAEIINRLKDRQSFDRALFTVASWAAGYTSGYPASFATDREAMPAEAKETYRERLQALIDMLCTERDGAHGFYGEQPQITSEGQNKVAGPNEADENHILHAHPRTKRSFYE